MFAANPRVNLVLDTIILVLFLVALISGLLLNYGYAHGSEGGVRNRGGRGAEAVTTSGGTDAILGITRAEMDTLHLYASLGTAALVGLHLVFHLNWIVCQLRRLFHLPLASAQQKAQPLAKAGIRGHER